MAKEPSNNQDKPFLTDVKALRERARQHIREGAVTEFYGGNTETACKVLNEALATELVCVLRYKRHYFMAKGIIPGRLRPNSSSMPRKNSNMRTVSRSASCNWVVPRTSRPKGCCRAAIRNTSRATHWLP